MRVPDDNRVDDVDKLLSDVKAVEERRQALIAELLRQKEAAIKAFDEKLAKLDYVLPQHAAKPRRSHHKKATEAPAKPKS